MFDFIGLLRGLFGGGDDQEQTQEQTQEQPQPQEVVADNSSPQQEFLNAQSGDNIQFKYNTGMSEDYKDALSDAIKFYHQEFKTTPRATISHGGVSGDDNITGITLTDEDPTGQYDVILKRLGSWEEDEAKDIAEETEAGGWHPKGTAGNLAGTPTHELGHALYLTLFPPNDTSSNSDAERSSDDGRDILYSALSDVGATKDNYKDYLKNVSGYAENGGAPEAIAESLVDYYYNRDDAADLSKAVIRRLKAKGSMRGVEQTGGFDTRGNSDNFIKNMRRYRVIQ